MNATAIIARDEAQLPAEVGPSTALTPMQMAYQLAARGTDVATIKEMLAIGREMEADQARRAFDEAMAAAGAEIPVIFKGREVDFTSTKGRTHYRYEDLASIARVVKPILGKYGLAYRYRVTTNLNEPVVVTCIVSHRQGHFEENTASAARDESGNKNSIQAVASTVTYLQRLTLKAALGLAASDDDDGAAASSGEVVSKEQLNDLIVLIEETDSDITRFCRHFHIEALPGLPASRFDEAKAILERKRK